MLVVTHTVVTIKSLQCYYHSSSGVNAHLLWLSQLTWYQPHWYHVRPQDLCPSVQSGQGCMTAMGPCVLLLATARNSGPPDKTHLIPVVPVLQMTIGGEMTVESLETQKWQIQQVRLLIFVWWKYDNLLGSFTIQLIATQMLIITSASSLLSFNWFLLSFKYVSLIAPYRFGKKK